MGARPEGAVTMKKISSGTTFLSKRVFPVLWFGFLAAFFVMSLAGGAADTDPAFLLVPPGMAAFGFVIMKFLVFDLMDEVHDAGDFLLVRDGGRQERIGVHEILNVSASTFTNPPRITLHLRRDSSVGRKIVFSPHKKLSLNPFARNEIAEDLILRVDAARSSKT